MKKRPKGFLSPDKISHESEVFDYIQELHEYLWEFVRAARPNALGYLNECIDVSLNDIKRVFEEMRAKGA